MSKLDEILEKGHINGRKNPSGYGEALSEAKQAIKDLFNELIGEVSRYDLEYKAEVIETDELSQKVSEL